MARKPPDQSPTQPEIKVPKHPGGRPSTYSPGIAMMICERLAEGDLAVDICAEDGFPSLSTLQRWKEEHPEFGAMHARARIAQAHACAERAVKHGRAATAVDAAAARVQFDADRWLAGRLLAGVYGDKVQQQHSGDADNPVVTTITYCWADPPKDDPKPDR